MTRYAGEWVSDCATTAPGRGCGGKIKVGTSHWSRSIPKRGDRTPPGPSTTAICSIAQVHLGPVDQIAAPEPPEFRVRWAATPRCVETYGALARWDRTSWDVWASIQMTNFAEQLGRALRPPGQRHPPQQTSTWGAATAKRHAPVLVPTSRKLSRPVRMVEDRLKTWRRATATARPHFYVEVAFGDVA
jgi:hypothetical protein